MTPLELLDFLFAETRTQVVNQNFEWALICVEMAGIVAEIIEKQES